MGNNEHYMGYIKVIKMAWVKGKDFVVIKEIGGSVKGM